jgi:hypothetical protein
MTNIGMGSRIIVGKLLGSSHSVSNSAQILDGLYNPDNAPMRDEKWYRDRAVYQRAAEKLTSSVRQDPSLAAALAVFALYLFKKRNVVPIYFKSTAAYCKQQARRLPLREALYLPEIEAFLSNVGLSCSPQEFDRAVIHRIDVFTHTLFSTHDPLYFDLKSHFIGVKNCQSPLDLLFHGLFLQRAHQSVSSVVRAAIGIVFVLISVLVYFAAR